MQGVSHTIVDIACMHSGGCWKASHEDDVAHPGRVRRKKNRGSSFPTGRFVGNEPVPTPPAHS